MPLEASSLLFNCEIHAANARCCLLWGGCCCSKFDGDDDLLLLQLSSRSFSVIAIFSRISFSLRSSRAS